MKSINNNIRRTSEREILVAELFEAVSHPTRIRILKTLAKRALGFAKLKSSLGFSSSGNLSHHLNKLGTLVQTNEQGNYELTDQGREALIAINAFGGFNKDWIRKTGVLIVLAATFLFYSTLLTIEIILGNAGDVLSTLLGPLVGSVIFFVIGRGVLQIWPLHSDKLFSEEKNNRAGKIN